MKRAMAKRAAIKWLWEADIHAAQFGAALEGFGLLEVKRDPDTDGGWVGSVADEQTAKRVAAELRLAGLDVSIASTDEPDDPVWIYVG